MTWTKPGLELRRTCEPFTREILLAAAPWQRLAYLLIASGRDVTWTENLIGPQTLAVRGSVRSIGAEARLVSWGPCSDPLPHLTFNVEPLRRTP